MKTLWAYGCSWTYSSIHDEVGLKFWPDIVAKHLNINKVINRGGGAESIGLAATKLMKDLPNIKKDDVVIFQFSYPDRQCYINFNHAVTAHDIRNYEIKGGDIKLMAYLDFILLFRSELILREFLNVEPIFDYIEHNIGAVVKYWFLNITPPEPLTRKEITAGFLEKTVWNEGRTVLFPPKEKRRNKFTSVFSRHIEAEAMISYDQLRFCDNGGIFKIFSPVEGDSHPDQRGQEMLAKCILHSMEINLPSPTSLLSSPQTFPISKKVATLKKSAKGELEVHEMSPSSDIRGIIGNVSFLEIIGNKNLDTGMPLVPPKGITEKIDKTPVIVGEARDGIEKL